MALPHVVGDPQVQRNFDALDQRVGAPTYIQQADPATQGKKPPYVWMEIDSAGLLVAQHVVTA